MTYNLKNRAAIATPIYSTNELGGSIITGYEEQVSYWCEIKTVANRHSNGSELGQTNWEADIKIIKRYFASKKTTVIQVILYQQKVYKITKIRSDDLIWEIIYAVALEETNLIEVNV